MSDDSGAAVTLGSSAIDFVVLVKPTGTAGTGSSVTPPQTPARSATFKALGNGWFVPRNIAPEANAIAVYNLSGKLIRRITGEKNIANIKNISGVPNSMYIVRLEQLPSH